MEWRVRVGDEEYVAGSTEMLQEWFAGGRIRSEHYVFHPLLEKWMYAGEIQELRSSSAVTVAVPVNHDGAWCPNCKNRNSFKTTEGVGWAVFIIALVSCGLGLIMIPFLPKTWHCVSCGHEWRA